MCFFVKHSLINKNQLIMSQLRTGKISASSGGNKTMVWSIFSYQVPEMVGTNTSTNEKHKFYYSTVQSISIGRE